MEPLNYFVIFMTKNAEQKLIKGIAFYAEFECHMNFIQASYFMSSQNAS